MMNDELPRSSAWMLGVVVAIYPRDVVGSKMSVPVDVALGRAV